MASEWKVFNIFFKDQLTLNDARKFSEVCEKLKREGSLGDYYYNMYSVEKVHLRLGLKKATQQAENDLRVTINELQKAGRVIGVEPAAPDLTDVDGVVMDDIKCFSRELSDIVVKRFGKTPTVNQAAYMIHFMMNQLSYPYQSELELYSTLDYSIRIALRRLLFGEGAHQNIESLIQRVDNLAAEFNSRYPSEDVFKVLEDLSSRLGDELDKLFPRSDPRTGQIPKRTLENQMWALDMIVANWEAWLHKSKSIEHYGRPNPLEEALLGYLIWASKKQVYDLGKERAEREKLVK
jgi:hypothetical protein